LWLTLEGWEARQRGKLREAKQWFERAVQVAPLNPATQIGLAVALLDLGEYEESRKLLHALLACPDISPDFRAYASNDLAWVDFFIGDDKLLDEALHFSDLAMARFPWLPQFEGTRGSVLVWANNLDAGVKLLREAFKENILAADRALNAAVLPGHAKKRRPNAGKRLFVDSASPRRKVRPC
jgi:tetratricopeptide (TPR) repeat protein